VRLGWCLSRAATTLRSICHTELHSVAGSAPSLGLPDHAQCHACGSRGAGRSDPDFDFKVESVLRVVGYCQNGLNRWGEED
jgi:hypothetical protein